MFDKSTATEGETQTVPAQDVVGSVALSQPPAFGDTPPEAPPEAPQGSPTVEAPEPEVVHPTHFSFLDFLIHHFEEGQTHQHFQLIASPHPDGGAKVSVQATGKAGDVSEFVVNEDSSVTKTASQA